MRKHNHRAPHTSSSTTTATIATLSNLRENGEKVRSSPEVQWPMSAYLKRAMEPEPVCWSLRVIDWMLVLWMVIALVAGLTTDAFQAFFHYWPDANLYGWPPQWLSDWYWWWCASADHLLGANPVWYQMMAFVSPLLYVPFYVYGIYAFATMRNAVRIPGIMYATAMTYSLVVILAEELFGEYRTPQPLVILAAYGSYLIMPIVMLVRLLWHEKPFGVGGDKTQ